MQEKTAITGNNLRWWRLWNQQTSNGFSATLFAILSQSCNKICQNVLLLTLFVLQETWKRSPLFQFWTQLFLFLFLYPLANVSLNSLYIMPGAHKKEPPYVQIGITSTGKDEAIYIVLDFAPKTGCHARFRFNVAGFVRSFHFSFFFFFTIFLWVFNGLLKKRDCVHIKANVATLANHNCRRSTFIEPFTSQSKYAQPACTGRGKPLHMSQSGLILFCTTKMDFGEILTYANHPKIL